VNYHGYAATTKSMVTHARNCPKMAMPMARAPALRTLAGSASARGIAPFSRVDTLVNAIFGCWNMRQ
jgi:hypothetical protein